jgi:hypothetical protein
MQTDLQNALPSPVIIDGAFAANTVDELTGALIAASDKQFASKIIEDDEERFDFLQACDTFNLWRMKWRLLEEFNDQQLVASIVERLRELICDRRKYDRDEFGLAAEATEERARFPFGLDPLRYAQLLARKNPIRVLKPEIQDPVSQQILAIAVHLQVINGPFRSVLLPIEQLRAVVRCRKLVVGGAVKRLIKHNMLLEVGEKARTGKAREFKLLAREGEDYEFVNGAGTEPKLPL